MVRFQILTVVCFVGSFIKIVFFSQRALKSNASEEKETPNEVWRGPVVMFKLAKSSNNKMIYVNVLPLDFNMFISQVLEAGPPKNEDEC